MIGYGYGYDNGNKRYKERLDSPTKSKYFYDGIYRLTRYERGRKNQDKTGMEQIDYYEDWSLDKLGNWNQWNKNGSIEIRNHNGVNELIKRDSTDLAYDENGNLIEDNNLKYEFDDLID